MDNKSPQSESSDEEFDVSYLHFLYDLLFDIIVCVALLVVISFNYDFSSQF